MPAAHVSRIRVNTRLDSAPQTRERCEGGHRQHDNLAHTHKSVLQERLYQDAITHALSFEENISSEARPVQQQRELPSATVTEGHLQLGLQRQQ